MMNIMPNSGLAVLATTIAIAQPVAAHQTADNIAINQAAPNALQQLILFAIEFDANRKQYAAQSNALRESSVASSTLMDPKLKVGFGGLPVDSFSFDDDPMTNLSVGLMQQFERGDTLELQSLKTQLQADGVALQINARERELSAIVAQLWLELGYQQTAARVIDENQRLMRQLVGFIETNYSLGKSEAQDLLNAQLKASKLDEQRQANQQVQQRLVSQLSEYLGGEWHRNNLDLKANNHSDWPSLEAFIAQIDDHADALVTRLNQHPMVQMADVNIDVNRTQVDIAKQSYQPQFGVEVMYAYRQANGMNGDPASDLVSAYLTLDIPLFTDNKQDRTVAAAQHQVGAAQSQKDRVLATLLANTNALLVERHNLIERIHRYQTTLLEQAKVRTHAVERGYENNTAQFSDVIAATSDELAIALEAQRLITDLNIVNAKLSALLTDVVQTDVVPADDHLR